MFCSSMLLRECSLPSSPWCLRLHLEDHLICHISYPFWCGQYFSRWLGTLYHLFRCHQNDAQICGWSWYGHREISAGLWPFFNARHTRKCSSLCACFSFNAHLLIMVSNIESVTKIQCKGRLLRYWCVGTYNNGITHRLNLTIIPE